MWYLDMLSEGVLHGDLNQEREHIKTSVEKLIQSQKGSIKLQCETLLMYEQILYNLDDEENQASIDSEQVRDFSKFVKFVTIMDI